MSLNRSEIFFCSSCFFFPFAGEIISTPESTTLNRIPSTFTPLTVMISIPLPIFFLYCRNSFNGRSRPGDETLSSKFSSSSLSLSSKERLIFRQSSMLTPRSPSTKTEILFPGWIKISTRNLSVLTNNSSIIFLIFSLSVIPPMLSIKEGTPGPLKISSTVM